MTLAPRDSGSQGPWLPNLHSTVITLRKKITVTKVGENCPPSLDLDGCKLCQMVSSGSLQAICMADILCLDSRAHYN